MIKIQITKNYKFQFSIFITYLMTQTLFLRFVYLLYGRDLYKLLSYVGFSLFICLILFFIRQNKWSLKDLGIRFDNFIKNNFLNFLISLFFVGGLFGLKNLWGRHGLDLFSSYHFYGLFILSSFGQEFVFRGFLIKLQQSIFQDKAIIITSNGVLFGLMHVMVIGEAVWFSFLGASFLGLVLAYSYLKNPNLFQLTIIHAIINLAVAWFGFFSFRV